MEESTQKVLKLENKFDPESCRHFLNGQTVVTQCHHYTALFIQLILDASELTDSVRLMVESSEDSFFNMFEKIFSQDSDLMLNDKIKFAEQFYAVSGLGKMKVLYCGESGGEVILTHSHVDEAWLRKWGNFNRPINFITQGFISAFFGSIYHKNLRSYLVREEESIVCGAQNSRFTVVLK